MSNFFRPTATGRIPRQIFPPLTLVAQIHPLTRGTTCTSLPDLPCPQHSPSMGRTVPEAIASRRPTIVPTPPSLEDTRATRPTSPQPAARPTRPTPQRRRPGRASVRARAIPGRMCLRHMSWARGRVWPMCATLRTARTTLPPLPLQCVTPERARTSPALAPCARVTTPTTRPLHSASLLPTTPPCRASRSRGARGGSASRAMPPGGLT